MVSVCLSFHSLFSVLSIRTVSIVQIDVFNEFMVTEFGDLKEHIKRVLHFIFAVEYSYSPLMVPHKLLRDYLIILLEVQRFKRIYLAVAL